ncbi:molybdenum cofactor guanylyltransferase MobA [Comamonas aquatica]|uniref:molybdenum cofactor guanylyltransferase MobA n=1 Tax=Comamonas aquatica TaxID=225991 RepID=UPI001B371D8E|nr:molybdenum cofactor guanylyltransferase MobA [Comamonas aquatica]QTX21708.1 molybdenum cofactor guanylyltransferase MobA [Comamonas aquatica]
MDSCPPHTPSAPLPAADITGMVLAGGRGSRMGGVDKGLQAFLGQPLALHALQRLQLQVGMCMLNANRHLEVYQGFHVPVHPDVLPDYAGPLAGFLTGLTHCTTPWLLTVPCDSPRFPRDLAQRMAATAVREHAQIVLAAGPEAGRDGTLQLRPQPVFALLHRSLLHSLQDFVQQGGRKIDAWTAQHAQALCRFDAAGDDVHAFANANTLQELRLLEASD